jgi:hypothetical protein
MHLLIFNYLLYYLVNRKVLQTALLTCFIVYIFMILISIYKYLVFYQFCKLQLSHYNSICAFLVTKFFYYYFKFFFISRSLNAVYYPKIHMNKKRLIGYLCFLNTSNPLSQFKGLIILSYLAALKSNIVSLPTNSVV